MSRITRRTRRDLREIASNAPISADAQSSILARVGEPVGRDDEEVVMLETNTYTFQHRPWAIPLAVAATVALGIAGIVLVDNRTDETGDVAPAASILPTADSVLEMSATLMERAEEFDAALTAQGLTGLVLDAPADVTDVYEFGDSDPPDWRAVEWPFESGPVEARLVLHESLVDPKLSGERLIVDTGRGTPDGDAWIDAVVQTMVRLREPELPESQIIDLATDLTASESIYYEEVWSSVFVSLADATGITVDAGSAHDFTDSVREAPLAEDVSPTLLARAEEFDALMAEQGLTGLVFEGPTDVTEVYGFGYFPVDDEPRDYRAVEWAFEDGPVEARFALHESLSEPGVLGERLTVTDGRGTPEGDAWVDAVIQTLVRWNEPDLPESQIVDLAANLVVDTSRYYEEVWSSVFASGARDSRTLVVETGSMLYFVESDRAEPVVEVSPTSMERVDRAPEPGSVESGT